MFGPSAPDHRDAFATVMSSTMTNFAKVVASAVRPPRPFQQRTRDVMDVELAVTSSSSSINNSNSRTSPGDAVPFAGVLMDRDVDEVSSGRCRSRLQRLSPLRLPDFSLTPHSSPVGARLPLFLPRWMELSLSNLGFLQ